METRTREIFHFKHISKLFLIYWNGDLKKKKGVREEEKL